MIFYASTGTSTSPIAPLAAEHAMTSKVYAGAASAGPPLRPSVQGFEGQLTEIKAAVQDVLEDFNWEDKKVSREFVTLEQKVLARRADPAEAHRYNAMKRDRTSKIFADRYLRDYAEIQRMKRLSDKLEEIQQDLRPFTI